SEKPMASGPAYHDIQGYMPKRKEFEVEPLNDAEQVIKDLAFYQDDTEQDIRLKLHMLDIYNTKLDRRMEYKRFVFERQWLDFRAQRRWHERKRSSLEKKLVNQTKVFCRLQTAADYEHFVHGLVREQQLRDRIAQLQHWRYVAGVSTLQQGEQYERDKQHRLEYLKQLLATTHERLQIAGSIPSSSSSSSTTTSINTMPRLMPNRPLPFRTPTVPSPAQPTARKPANPLDISTADGIDLLTPEEQKLCSTLRLLPRPYLVIKDTILAAYAKQGFLKRRATRALIKIDVNKTSKIYDFFIESGWITA
ncbi:Homeodomain-like protein, partial [Halteromyces radiatus]|uniref:Homeodomain-like protein n=1 Tax=Halteromyces radiatus TaxID=101107 RepID=UPI002220C451